MADFFQTLIAAVAVGSLYALVALGYTLVYGVLKFINFAHSDIFVLGAWTSFTAATVVTSRLGVSPEAAPWWVAMCVFLLAVAVCSTTGYLIERFAYRPLRKAPRLNVLITAIGVSLLLQNVGQIPGPVVATSPEGAPLATVPFGPTPKSMPTLLPDAVLNEATLASGTASGGSKRGVIKLDKPITLEEDKQYRLQIVRTDGGETRAENLNIAAEPGTYEAGAELPTQPRRNAAEVEGAGYRLLRMPVVPIRLIDVLIVASSLALMALLQLLVFKTKIGAAMRALSFNTETAALMGVNVNFVISFTFVLGTALAASAAFLYPMKYPGLNQTAHGVWVLLGLKAFVAAVVGGIGNIRGAVLGGFLIAGIEFFGSRYVSTELKDVYVFGLLIVVLLVRPSGLLGTTVREKV
ncbi:MAG TPA: branched-chain amino acid ABC transporter permease [Phycisphaerales bacterium]|nr:branched-chain amino acid ABC transporter permease [Phycisphaerales bacterium]